MQQWVEMGQFDMSDIDKWLGLSFFDVAVKIYRTCLLV